MNKHLASHRARHAERRALIQEIEQYRTHADLLEITEILSRYPESETAELRRAVGHQLVTSA